MKIGFLKNLWIKQAHHIKSNDWQIIEENYHNPNINLFILSRELDQNATRYINYLLASGFSSCSQMIRLAHLEKDIELLGKNNLPNTPFIDIDDFINDLKLLSKRFMHITESDEIKLILKVITNDACTKFHVDRNPHRLLCTYSGPGTEWLKNHQVRRGALGTTNESIVKDDQNIQQIKTYDVAILKGEQIGTNFRHKGIVHRSPEIEATNKKRLLLRLDVN